MTTPRILLVLSFALGASLGLRAAGPGATEAPDLSFLFETRNGLVGVGSRQVWQSPDGGSYSSVYTLGDGYVVGAGLADDRLVLARSDKSVEVVSLDGGVRATRAPFSRTVEYQTFLSVAGGGGQVIVLDGARLHRLDAQGTWSTHEPQIARNFEAISYSRGTWVLAGTKAAATTGTTDNAPGVLALWWSVDGVTWNPARHAAGKEIAASDVVYRGVQDLVGTTAGFMVVTSSGIALRSPDGQRWSDVTLPKRPYGWRPWAFAAGGKFWLKIHQPYPSREFTFHTSADGRAWTDLAVPPGMSIEKLVELRGQAWIYGRSSTRRGLLARAETPTQEATPPSVAAGAPAPVVVAEARTASAPSPAAAPAPLAAAPPGAPAMAAASTVVSAGDVRVATLVAALAEFDQTITKAEPGGFAEPAARLLRVLRENAGSSSSLPAFRDAVLEAVGRMVEQTAGLEGYLSLATAADKESLQPLLLRLSHEKRQVLRARSNLLMDGYNRALAQSASVDHGAEIAALGASWPVRARGPRGPSSPMDVDLRRFYERAVQGDRAAAADLMISHGTGQGTPKDDELFALWLTVFTQSGGPPFPADQKLNREYIARLAEAGSAIARAIVADEHIQKIPLATVSASDVALYAQAVAGGFTQASRVLAEIRKAQGSAIPAASPIPDSASLPVAALADFETAFQRVADLSDIGLPAATLLKGIDGKIPAPVAAAFIGAVNDFVVHRAGAKGWFSFTQALPDAGFHDLNFKIGFSQTPETGLKRMAMHAATKYSTQLTEEALRSHPAEARRRGASKGRGTLDLALVRARLLSGDAGAALDLALEYRNGWGTSVDSDLFDLLVGIATRLNPALASMPEEQTAMMDAMVTANSAAARYMKATALLPRGTKIIPPGPARTLLEEAAARGHTLARAQLNLSDVEEAQR